MKEIAVLCELKINLTHHKSERPLPVKFLGIPALEITQAHYGQILEESVLKVMGKLNLKMKEGANFD